MASSEPNMAGTSTKENEVDSEENVMKYYLMPSLQHITLVYIIITLWKKADVKKQLVKIFKKCDKCTRNELFSKLEKKVINKVTRLAVPNRIREMLSNLVHPIGKEISEWIEHQDEYIFFNVWNLSPNHIAINYIDALVWTSRGTIDYKKTAKILLTDEKLSEDYQCYISCNYCLEDEITKMATKVINSSLRRKSIKLQAMVYFWTARITGDYTELVRDVDAYNRKFRTNCSTNEYLFRNLILYNANQVAIKYMWGELNNEEKSKQLLSGITLTSDGDITCFLLSQINKKQEIEILTSFSFRNVLLRFFDHWLWRQYFLPTFHRWKDIMGGKFYFSLVKGLVREIRSNHFEKFDLYQNTLEEIWRCTPKHLKEYFFEHDELDTDGRVLVDIFKLQQLFIFELIVADITDEKKRQIIFSWQSFGMCEDYIKSDEWDLLDVYTESVLFSEEDVDAFKRRFMEQNGKSTAEYFVKNREWHKVEKLTKWAFQTDNEAKIFRQNLTYLYDAVCRDILESIFYPEDFSELENFLEWFAFGDEEQVTKRKSEIPKLYFEELVCTLMHEDNYDLLENILKWCYVNDPKQIAHYKQSSLQDNIYYIVHLIIDLVKCDDHLESLKKFASFWCSTDDELNTMKTVLLHRKEARAAVCSVLLGHHMLELADEYVNWCCNESQMQIISFKHQLISGDYMDYLNFISTEYRPLVFFDKRLIKWFNPSVETVTIIKKKFRNWSWIQEIVSVLDCYNQKHQRFKDMYLEIEDRL